MEPHETPSRRAEELRLNSTGAVAILQDLRAELLSMDDDRPSALPEIFGPALQPNLGMALGSLRELVEESRAGLVRIVGDVEQLRAELHVVKRSLSTSLTTTESAEKRLDAETFGPTWGSDVEQEAKVCHKRMAPQPSVCKVPSLQAQAESKLEAAVTAMGTRVSAVEERFKEQVLKKEVKQEIELIQSTIEARLAQFRETVVMHGPLPISVPEPLNDQKDEEFSTSDEDDDALHGQQGMLCRPEQNRFSLSSLMARVESLEAVQRAVRGTPEDVTALQRRMQLLEHNLTDDICTTLASMSTEISALVQCLASGNGTENGGFPQESMSQAAARSFARKELPSTELGRRGMKRLESASLEEPRTFLRPEVAVTPRALSRRAGVSASPSAYTGGSAHLISRSPNFDDPTPQVQEEDTEQAPERSSKISEEIREAAKTMAEENRTGLDQALSLLSTSLRQIWHARNQSLGQQSAAPNSAMTLGYRQELSDQTSSVTPALPADARRWAQPGAANVTPAFLASSGSNARLPLHLPLSEVSQQGSGAPMSPAVSPRLVPSFIGLGCRTTALTEAHRRLTTHPRPGSAVLMLSGGGGAGDKMLSQRSQDMTRFVAVPSPAPGGCDVRWMAPPPAGCGVPGRSISTAEAGDSAMLTAKKILLQRQEMQSA